MKNLPHNIEDLLQTQKGVGLTMAEKATMFSELQAFADLHTSPAVRDLKPPSYTWFAKWAVGVASVFLILGGTGYASTQSLPGEPLYGVKVSVVEPLVGLVYVNESDQLQYQISLMERRLQEMETLYRTDVLTEGVVAVLEEQITEQAEDFKTVVTITDTTELTPEVTVEAVSNLATTLRKQNLLIEKELGESRSSVLDDLELRVDHLYEAEVAEFVTTKPAAVTSYVEGLLNEVDEQVITDPSTASSSAIELHGYLEQVEETLEEGDLKGAIESAEEATQLLDANSFSETLSGSVTEIQ